MRSECLFFLLSLLATLLGLSLVFGFMTRYLVPNANRIDVVYTACEIADIRPSPNHTNCVSVIIAHSVDNTTTAHGYLYPDGRKQQLPSHCFCSHCNAMVEENNTSLTWNRMKLSIGDQLSCFYRLSELSEHSPLKAAAEGLNQEGSTDNRWLLFNVMFWPTLLFITGFVCLFFASINLFYLHTCAGIFDASKSCCVG